MHVSFSCSMFKNVNEIIYHFTNFNTGLTRFSADAQSANTETLTEDYVVTIVRVYYQQVFASLMKDEQEIVAHFIK